MPYRQSLFKADVTVGIGTGQTTMHLGIADKWSGGDGGTNNGTYNRSSGLVNLGGDKTRDDGTATYLVDEIFWKQWKALDRGRGQLDVSISLVPTGDDGTAFADGPITLTGKVATVPIPTGDFSSNEGNSVDIGFNLDAERA